MPPVHKIRLVSHHNAHTQKNPISRGYEVQSLILIGVTISL